MAKIVSNDFLGSKASKTFFGNFGEKFYEVAIQSGFKEYLKSNQFGNIKIRN